MDERQMQFVLSYDETYFDNLKITYARRPALQVELRKVSGPKGRSSVVPGLERQWVRRVARFMFIKQVLRP